MTEAAVYLRQSLDRTGEALAVARQRVDCLGLCEERGWTPIEYVDNDTSASTNKRRPAYERMLTDIRDGRVGSVVCWHLDRLHRRPMELERFMELADKHSLQLATVTGDVDLSTDDGQFMARIMGAVARKEIDRKRARQLSAAKQKATQGRPQWKRAFGYLDDTREPDPFIAPLVAQAYASIIAGASLSDICRLWNDAGALTQRHVKRRDEKGNLIYDPATNQPIVDVERRLWTHSQVSNFLRKPRNAALRGYNGEIVLDDDHNPVKCTWAPIVDESTWRAAQSVLNAPGRAPGKKSVQRHLLTRVLGCGKCGGYLSGMQTRDKRIVYQCKTCHGCSVRADYVEPMLIEAVGQRLSRADAIDLVRAEQLDATEAEAMRTETNTLLTRLDEIADERADGLLTGAQAKRATDRIQAKLDAIEHKQRDQTTMRVLDDIRIGTDEAVDDVAELSPDRLRAVMELLGTVTVAPVGKGHRANGVRFDPDRVTFDWR
ncbi:recombinase family protein [Mycolicibacter hiberniae]|uniref:Serine recombinase n=1 Tax=Mycolicibacter hiberniae TaxID=29314 RepID=A0A7I7WZ32_9MYCO|nr:recombinase family protein [Mycolicibacter hiberniae]MCV7085803.1 recombinase family protein [Mycolicibacter hiberniae]ORV73218.1 serine recombinase [Mycolicibacter hiberniae]BBZ22819.1 serine recombinase [Mycolicibacter hiberniae]